MKPVKILPGLYLLPFAVGNAYVWRGSDGLTLIDCGLPGSGPAISAALRSLGDGPADVRRLILTHFHPDHAGSAAEVASFGDVQVLAHSADAPYIRGTSAGPAPDLAEWEKPLFAQIASQLPAGPAEAGAGARIDIELADGTEVALGGTTALVVAVPGHTPGSIALHLPAEGVLLTGDTIARGPDGRVIPGVFNADRPAAAASARRLAGIDIEVAGFGHGEPLTAGAAAGLRAALRGPATG
jgi:glyoxylase-like metal-dependent hydrolase (beta-lactamase superfamily II)